MTQTLKFLTLQPSERVPSDGANLVVLAYDNWDDWFEFETTYSAYYFDTEGKRTHLGGLKIGQKDQKSRRASVPREFSQLEEPFFSVGLSEDYYKAIYETARSQEILPALNDMAANLTLLEQFKNERVASTSLFRTVDDDRIRNKFHRLSKGDAALTPYSFEYVLDESAESDDGSVIRFEVSPNSLPPTNIHTLIGRNGVGKTTVLNNIVNAYLDSFTVGQANLPANVGKRLRIASDHGGGSFANLISVTFSAFDPFFPESNPYKGRYSYIGLKESLSPDQGKLAQKSNISFRVKSPDDLTADFIASGERCLESLKRRRWADALRNLASDPIFEESEIVELSDECSNHDEWREDAARVFRQLSSGHKIVLLTITRLVELVEEQSLVLLDEPESHLHPPLLSAFVRTLSELLTAQNGVAIIATHSPVVLQETPRSCAWIMDRSGYTARARRPIPETFGENVGRLTHEVFGLEVTETGFYELLRRNATTAADYDDVITQFEDQIGTEGQAVLRALLNRNKVRVR